MTNTIYIRIPKSKINAFQSEIELGSFKPHSLKETVDKKYVYAEFRFQEDLSDIRVRYLVYALLVLHFGLGKKTLKEFNKIDDIEFGAIDFNIRQTYDSIIDIVELTETALLFKDSRTINNFCAMVKIAKINNQPAVLRINKETSGGLFNVIMSRENTWSSMEKLTEDFTAIAFTIRAEDFDIDVQTEVELINVDIEDEKCDNLRVQRLQNKCALLEDFTNLNQDELFWEDVTLKFLLSRLLKVRGGQQFFKKQTLAMNLSADTYKMLERVSKVYKAKNTYYKCSNANCPHYNECQSKKMYSTTELLFDRYEPIKPITLLPVSEAKTELAFMMYDGMQNELRFNDMVIIKVPTSLGKTTAYTKWVIDSLIDFNLRRINIIAVPTIKLAMQVKAEIESLLEENNLQLTVYSVQEVTPILEKISTELLEQYENFNRLGAYTRASKLLHKESERIVKKHLNEEPLTMAEKQLIAFMENKKKVSALNELNSLYIVTHEWLSFQKDTSKLSGRTIVIDEDIFNSLVKLDSLKIKDLYSLEFKLETMLAQSSPKNHRVIKEALKLVRNMREHFVDKIVDYKHGEGFHVIKKEDGQFDVISIDARSNTNLIDTLIDALLELKIESNILGFFEADYYVKNGDEIHYVIRRDLYIDRFKKNTQGTKYIMFSATADETIYREVFASRKLTASMDIKFYDMGPVESMGKTVQITNISGSKTQLNTANADNVKNIHAVIEQAKTLTRDDVKMITYKEYADAQQNHIRRYGERKYDIDIVDNMYLGNTAGYNDLIGQDLIILGGLRCPDYITFLTAKSLGIELRQSGALKYRTVEYGYYRFKFYCYENNEALNHLIIWSIDRENVQAAGRNRNRWNNATTVIISPIPNAEATIIDSKINLTKPKFNKVQEDELTQAELSSAIADILSSIE